MSSLVTKSHSVTVFTLLWVSLFNPTMGIKGLTALLSEHAPKCITASMNGFSLPETDPCTIGTWYKNPVWSQSRDWRVHVHLSIPHRSPPKGRGNAQQWARWDNEVRGLWRMPHLNVNEHLRVISWVSFTERFELLRTVLNPPMYLMGNRLS